MPPGFKDCDLKVRISRPVLISHNFNTGEAMLPETAKRPSGEKAKDLNPPGLPVPTTSFGTSALWQGSHASPHQGARQTADTKGGMER